MNALADLLSVTCQAEVARRIAKPRGYVWRLAAGGPLTDISVIPALARALHQRESYLTAMVLRDLLDRRERAILAGRRESRAVRSAIRALQSSQERAA